MIVLQINNKEIKCSNIQLCDIEYSKSLLTPNQQKIVELYEEAPRSHIMGNIRATCFTFIEQLVEINIDNSCNDTDTHWCHKSESMSYTSASKSLVRIEVDNIYKCPGYNDYINIRGINDFLLDICQQKKLSHRHLFEPIKNICNITDITISKNGKIILTDCNEEIEGFSKDGFVYTNESAEDKVFNCNLI
jgi:hypothetical protein